MLKHNDRNDLPVISTSHEKRRPLSQTGRRGRNSSDSSFHTQTISAHGAVFIVNTADCRLIGGDCMYLHINLPNYPTNPAIY